MFFKTKLNGYILWYIIQDSCENFFSSLRGIGGPNNHPDVVEAMLRVKIRLLCSEGDIVVPLKCPSVEAEDLDNYVPHTLAMACKERPNTFLVDEFEEEEEAQRAIENSGSDDPESSIALNDCEEQGLNYVAGFLCYKKGKKKHPQYILKYLLLVKHHVFSQQIQNILLSVKQLFLLPL